MIRPKVSIITVCFNSKPFISTAIDSVLRQDYPNIEYIVVDGGSTDGTLDIIKSYESENQNYIENEIREYPEGYKGFEFELRNGRTMFDYKHIPEWQTYDKGKKCGFRA